MSQKRRISKKTIVMTAVLGSVLIMAVELANNLWSSRQTSYATDEAVSIVSSFYLEAMADRRAKTVTNLIRDCFDEMEKALTFIGEEEIGSKEELHSVIGKLEGLLGLNRFALVDEDDVVYTQYTTYTGRSRHTFLEKEEIEGQIISTVTLYGSSKQLCLAIPAAGLTILGKPMKACFVQIDMKEIAGLLDYDDSSTANFALYSKTGSNLSGTRLGPFIRDQNLFEALQNVLPEETLREHSERFAGRQPGRETFSAGEAEETLCYVPIEGTDWEMAALIRESLIQSQIREISEKNLTTLRRQIVFTLVAVFLFGTILLIQMWMLSRDKIEEEKEASKTLRNLANTDSMTGVRNKHAYSEHEKRFNQQILEGSIERLAVVVGDINGLKQVNDTRGHAAGDQLIRDGCALLCECFHHGMVFRIGGDEFVILLQGKGFDRLQEAADELNRRVEANIEKEAVVISIGYSVLTQEDRQLRDVFERADQMMYERKKELKAMGAPTGRL